MRTGDIMTIKPSFSALVLSFLMVSGCGEEDLAPGTFEFDWESVPAGELDAVDEGLTDDCPLPTVDQLLERSRATVGAGLANVAVSVSEPIRLADASLPTAIETWLAGLVWLDWDGMGGVSVSQGFPTQFPDGDVDLETFWRGLADFDICGAAVVRYELPARTLETVAWIVDPFTIYEPLADLTLIEETPGPEERRTDETCSSSWWEGWSLAQELDLGPDSSFVARFGICGDWVEESDLDEPDVTFEPYLECSEPSPTVVSEVELGHFTCGDLEPLECEACCGARLPCTLTYGIGSWSVTRSRTLEILACPYIYAEEGPPPEECDEW